MKRSVENGPRRAFKSMMWAGIAAAVFFFVGCATQPAPKAEPLVGMKMPIRKGEAGYAAHWGTVTVKEARLGTVEPDDGSPLANDWRAQVKAFAGALEQSKLGAGSAPVSGSAGTLNFQVHVSLFTQMDLPVGKTMLSALTMDMTRLQANSQTTVTIVAERADGLRRFFRANSASSGKMHQQEVSRLVDVIHVSTKECFNEILQQMEQETEFFAAWK
jgi:hypothetical protein